MLVAIAGKARVGKDTVGRYLAQNYNFEHFYFAHPLKQMLEHGLDLREVDFQTTEEKERVIPELGRSYRYLAQKLGTEWGRNMVHPDLWVKLIEMRWKRLQTTSLDARLVLTDCRFDNEAEWVRAAGGVVVHIQGSGEFAGMTEQTRAHSSEAGVAFVDGDRLLFNHYAEPTIETLRQLYASVDALMAGLINDQEYARVL
jgi:hypothetical protein